MRVRERLASVHEAGAGVGVDWRSILHSKWRTTDAKGTNGVAGNRLREAPRQLELWRLRRRRPGRIPTDLRLLPAEAAAEHGVEPIARKLRLNSERLEEWAKRGHPALLEITRFAWITDVH